MKRNILYVVLLTLILALLSNYLIDSKKLLISTYENILTIEELKKILEVNEKWKWLGYIFSILIIFIRVFLVAICLSLGLFFYNTEDKTKFKDLFRIAFLGEFVLVLVGYLKLLYFAFIKTDYTLEDFQEYYPLSYINLLDLTKIEPWLIYPLQTVNLFEVAYFFVLVYGLHKLLKNNYWKSFEITAASYGIGLLIWLGLVSFLTLSIT